MHLVVFFKKTVVELRILEHTVNYKTKREQQKARNSTVYMWYRSVAYSSIAV